MKFRIGKVDAFMFSLIFIILSSIFVLPFYFFGWYNVVAFWIAIFIIGTPLIYVYSFLDKVFPTLSISKWTLNGFIVTLINCITGLLFIGFYFYLRINFESAELKNHGVKTVGIVQSSYYRKGSINFIIDFKTFKNKNYETEIVGEHDDYKKGDTIKVIYSERIPAINRAE